MHQHSHTVSRKEIEPNSMTCTSIRTQCAGLLKEIESRGQRSEYQRLLVECQNLYAQARLQLVSPLLSQRLAIDQVIMCLKLGRA
eukprot:1156421-Pelagomonas_calceolata.AAC.9